MKRAMDRRILEVLVEKGFDGCRQHMYENITKFQKLGNVDLNIPMTDDKIESITETRSRYYIRYVFHVSKRLKDLYYIENTLSQSKIWKKMEKTPKSLFLTFLLKEKLEGNNNYKLSIKNILN